MGGLWIMVWRSRHDYTLPVRVFQGSPSLYRPDSMKMRLLVVKRALRIYINFHLYRFTRFNPRRHPESEIACKTIGMRNFMTTRKPNGK